MDPVKLEAVRKWPRPKTVKDIQKFLGFCNFYRRFVKNYSELARPLFDLTKKGKLFIWTEHQDTAFTGLQDALTSSPVLLLPNYGRPFMLYIDASDYATSAILEQDDALGRSHPVTYYSKCYRSVSLDSKCTDERREPSCIGTEEIQLAQLRATTRATYTIVHP